MNNQLYRLTYVTRHSEEIRQDDNNVGDDQRQMKTDAELHAAAAKDDNNQFVHLINLAAIIVIMVGAFFWGFYA